MRVRRVSVLFYFPAYCPVFGHSEASFYTKVIWRAQAVEVSIGRRMENMRPLEKLFFQASENPASENPFEVTAVMARCAVQDGFEISPRFRRSIEERAERLERDAGLDEAQVKLLVDGDHIRRHMRLVAMQRFEALRMRLFLDRARVRLPRPLIEL
jgi:hypothetical protein